MLLIRKPWDSQPQEAVGPASEFADAYILWRGVGGGAIEFDASNYKNDAVVNAGTPSSIVGSTGKAIRFPNENTSMRSSRAISVSGPFTVFTWIRNAVTPSSSYYRLLETNFATGLFLGVNTARTKWNFIVNNASLEGCISTTSVSSGLTFICGVFDGTSRNLYVNGVLEASAAATSPNSSGILYWSTIAAGSNAGIQGDQQNVGYFPRAFSASLVKSIYDNPWQLFAPRSIWVPVSAATGGAYTLTADAGAYVIGGQDAALVKSRIVAADAGAYSLAGQDAALTYAPAAGAYTLTAEPGAYVLGGQDAALKRGRVVSADAGAYALAGQDATLTYAPPNAYTLTCEAGAYAIGGQAATIAFSGATQATTGGWLGQRRRTKREIDNDWRKLVGLDPIEDEPDYLPEAAEVAEAVKPQRKTITVSSLKPINVDNFVNAIKAKKRRRDEEFLLLMD